MLGKNDRGNCEAADEQRGGTDVDEQQPVRDGLLTGEKRDNAGDGEDNQAKSHQPEREPAETWEAGLGVFLCDTQI